MERERRFLRLALEKGYLSQVQAKSVFQLLQSEKASVEEICLRLKFLDEQQAGTISRSLGEAPTTRKIEVPQGATSRNADCRWSETDWKRRSDEIFARLLVSEGLFAVPKVREFFELLEKSGEGIGLGQFLVRQKLLDPATFSQIHRQHQDSSLSCPSCGNAHAVSHLCQVRTFSCAACGHTLQEPEALKGVSLDIPQHSPFAPGSEFGNYILLEEIARGGMGIVFKARQKEVGRIVALKVMRQMDAGDEEQVARFQREIQTAGRLAHPNIVAIYDAGRVNDSHYLTMECIEGRTLSEVIQKGISVKSAVRLAEKIARAVDYAHGQNIIHRDLKPANILVDKDGEPHIVDFGLARDMAHDRKLTQSGTAVGTPQYMSPEQIEAKARKIGRGTDIYALGVILYEMLAGRPPFNANSVAKLYQQILMQDPPKLSRGSAPISSTLEAIALKAMAKKPENRYPSAQDFAQELMRFRLGKKSGKRAFSRLTRGLGWKAAAVSAVAVLAIAFGIFFGGGGEPSGPAPVPGPVARKGEEPAAQIREVWLSGGSADAERKAEEILAARRGEPAALAVYGVLGELHLEAGRIDKARANYENLYVFSSDRDAEILGMAGLLECSLREGRYVCARKILESALAEYGPEETKVLRHLSARVWFHCGEFDRSAEAWKDAPTSEKRTEEARWLSSLTPVREYDCDARHFELLDVDRDGRSEIALFTEQDLLICSVGEKGLSATSRYPCPAGAHLVKDLSGRQAAAGDLTGNGAIDIVVAATWEKEHMLLFFLGQPGTLAAVKKLPLESQSSEIWIGRLDKSGRDSLVIGMLYPARNSKIVRFQGKDFGANEIDLDLRKGCTDTTSVDVGDWDGDGNPELLLGTGCWTHYDVRVYGYSSERMACSLLDRRQLGSLSGCRFVNLDGSGPPEIAAVKSHTVNHEVFRENGHGAPDGLYLFRCAGGKLQDLWSRTYPAGSDPRRTWSNLCVGALGDAGPAIATIYAEDRAAEEENPSCREQSQQMWLVRWSDAGPVLSSFSRAEGISRCAIGDVDGDGRGELIWIEGKKLRICGADFTEK